MLMANTHRAALHHAGSRLRLQRFAARLVNPRGSNTCWLNSIMQQLFANPHMRSIFGKLELSHSASGVNSSLAAMNSKSDDPRLPNLVVGAFAAAIDSMQQNIDDANAASNPKDSCLVLSAFASFVQTFWVEDSVQGIAPVFIRRRQHDVTEFFTILLSSLDAAFAPNLSFIKTHYGVCVKGSRRCKVCGDEVTFESPVREMINHEPDHEYTYCIYHTHAVSFFRTF